ncbi:hypothetical protein QBC39DRAFT_181941 [Podospora conica]|nr:hypothetical protein QBC39DRAFT_181941 [Schizothecium conicum]
MYIPSHDQHLTTAFAFLHSPGLDLCILLVSADLNLDLETAQTWVWPTNDVESGQWAPICQGFLIAAVAVPAAGKSLDRSRESLWVTGNLPRIRVPLRLDVPSGVERFCFVARQARSAGIDEYFRVYWSKLDTCSSKADSRPRTPSTGRYGLTCKHPDTSILPDHDEEETRPPSTHSTHPHGTCPLALPITRELDTSRPPTAAKTPSIS